MKTNYQKEQAKLKKTLLRLKEKHNTDEIFRALTSIEDDWLLDEVKIWLNIHKGLNVLKIDRLDNQMKFEEALNDIYPYDNDKQQNLFLTY